MIRKILIANRGEIAVRLIRACAEMKVTSVAVFTEPDRHALHVKQADEAYLLGPDPLDGYLNIHRIVNIALATGCDAIHPGYGFLSENPSLAEACKRRHLIFIGPPSSVISAMGDKIAARQTMRQAGLPIIPGSDGPVQSLEEAKQIALTIGYPVMLKAANGGGGRGIRRVNNENELQQQYDRVRSEAQKAFGDQVIFIEKYVQATKHIEVQILADKYGSVIHLFDRDCSIQRRHQKLIEIAPSPQIDKVVRKQLTDYAVKASEAIRYENAGTVEFLVDNQGKCYFMEMNTRLQVEHTITEQITGIDIVQEQIRIAAGKKLSYEQRQVKYRGYAIQFRINAEDPQNNFLPSFGKISQYYSPGGPGVRTDSGIYSGYVIPPFYDSLCVKLTVWALKWNALLLRAERALREIGVNGVKTTIPFYREILCTNAFVRKSFDTSFIEQHPELQHYSHRTRPDDIAAVITAAIAAHLGL